MGDLLVGLYPWAKSLHIIAVLTWMAGLFYLPRLFVYHVEQVEAGSQTDALFQTMERRLLRYIMNPSLIAVWVFGLFLVFTPQAAVYWDQPWPWLKSGAVIAMTWFHMWLAVRRKRFVEGTNALSGKRYRMMNEVPTILMLVIVFSVVFKF